ncbi:hypothetical protein EYM_07400 [Ignicoccus islandicus DSM 13165]|uniref:Uncharacterized protein n=1 Tax=Ignicoccus islandicus DSM 13165 TaxID=940295 RepID=A0A0U3FAR5_9CREN|nr:hypothetical protein [Ignicoccus islandicus]ALU12777.1 hypothetical protein EYM_07400 [Ignicoccus islandicus DSM 13165]
MQEIAEIGLMLLIYINVNACCIELLGRDLVYAYQNVLNIANLTLTLPFDVVCLSNGILGIFDGERTYFYSIIDGGVRPVGFDVEGLVSNCNYKPPFLVVSIPSGIVVEDMEKGVRYSFPDAIMGASCSDGFVIYRNEQLEVHVGTGTKTRNLLGIPKSINCYNNEIAICTDENIMLLRNDEIIVKGRSCSGIDISGKFIVSYEGSSIEIYDHRLNMLARAKVNGEIIELKIRDNVLAVLTTHGIYLYEIVELRRGIVVVILLILSIFSLSISIFRFISYHRI